MMRCQALRLQHAQLLRISLQFLLQLADILRRLLVPLLEHGLDANGLRFVRVRGEFEIFVNVVCEGEEKDNFRVGEGYLCWCLSSDRSTLYREGSGSLVSRWRILTLPLAVTTVTYYERYWLKDVEYGISRSSMSWRPYSYLTKMSPCSPGRT